MKKLKKPTPDAVLVKAYMNGDENALSLLITRHKEHLYNFIFSKVFDHAIAEDVFQETFIKVIRTLKRGKYNEEGKFLSWVMRIAHNLVIDHFRKSNRMPKFESSSADFDIFSVLADDKPHAEKQLMDQQIKRDVQNLIQELPEEQLEVLKMRIYKDMSFKEIAYHTDVSINTALGRMRYALINLRKVIDEHHIVLTEQ